MRGQLSFVVSSFLLFSLVGAADIPDRIDYEKYSRLHDAQKQVSDAARRDANAKKADYDTKKRTRLNLEGQKSTQEDKIRSSTQEITRLEGRIAELNQKIQNLQVNTNSNDAEIVRLQAEVADLIQKIAAKDAELVKPKPVPP